MDYLGSEYTQARTVEEYRTETGGRVGIVHRVD